MYKELVEKANLNLRREQTQTAILKRNAYFILDEFANLPKFENIEGMVTVARSRGIRFLFVLQAYSQLTAKYGRDIGDIIKTNCNVKIFIGSDDSDTRKEFSELCGQKKIKNFSVNTNAENPASSNTGASNQPLITVGMLERLNGDKKGDAIVSVRGYEPIWTVFTPSYELKDVYFKDGKASMAKREAVLFDKNEYVFDITNKNGGNEHERLLTAIEEEENRENAVEIERQKKLDDLDGKWLSIEKNIQLKLQEFANMLNPDDKQAVLKADLNSIVALLFMIEENYNNKPHKARKIREVAEYINGELPKLLELQNQAIK